MRRTLICWMSLALALAITSLAQAQGCRNRFVVFGDSLTDPGNVYAATGNTVKAPFSPIPDWPYSIGGHHFSNGKTWAERLAESLGSPASGAPEQVNPLFTNYAFGGARARSEGPNPEVSLTNQVVLFLGNFNQQACHDPTYIIWIGGDDLRDALPTLATDPTGATAMAIIVAAVESISDNIEALAGAGAQTFLVFDAPDISKAPFVIALGPAAVDAAATLSAVFNALLGNAITDLIKSGKQITRFNENPLIAAVEADPGQFGLLRGIKPCLNFGVIAHAICNAPPLYFFWDAIHPTTAGHGILADEVKTSIFQ